MRERVSKRVLGFVASVVGLTMALLDGFGWFSVNEVVTIGVFSYSAALLGIDAFKK